jgi:beta-glucanase (GH16 family)
VSAVLVAALVFAASRPRRNPPGRPGGTNATRPVDLSRYDLRWADEFNGADVNLEEWSPRTDDKYSSRQSPEAVTVSDGSLVIGLQTRDASDGGPSFRGGGLVSRRAFRYGYYETRVRMPSAMGWHSSFWLMDENDPSVELDVVEFESALGAKFSANVHRMRPDPYIFGAVYARIPDITRAFHVFGCEYTPSVIRFFADGRLFSMVDATRLPVHGDVRLRLSSVGGWKRSPTVDGLPDRMFVDYVRVYEPKPGTAWDDAGLDDRYMASGWMRFLENHVRPIVLRLWR